MAKGPHTRPSIAKAVWVARAVDLSNAGLSYRRIGAAVGKHWTTVEEALQKEFERVRAPAEVVETRRARLSEQLEGQITVWLPKSSKGDKDAAMVLNRFWESYRKLWGLDAPIRTEHTGADGAPIVFNVSSLTNEQLRLAAADDSGEPSGAEGSGSGGTGETGEDV